MGVESSGVFIGRERLIERQQSLARAYNDHGPAVRALLIALTRDGTLTDDLHHDVFVAALRSNSFARITVADEQRAWLLSVARRRVVDHWRQQWTQRRAASPYDDSIASPDHRDEREAARFAQAFRDSVRDLAPSLRAVVTLSLVGGRDVKEISDRLGTSQPACRMRLTRGLRALATTLREQGFPIVTVFSAGLSELEVVLSYI